MADMEKVIKGLECLITNKVDCDECPYNEGDNSSCLRNIANDALELLKDHEKIILCKDCKYWKNKYMEYDVHPWLPCMEINTKGNWFCAEGERQS